MLRGTKWENSQSQSKSEGCGSVETSGSWLSEHSLLVLLLLGTIFNVAWLIKMRDKLRIKWPAGLVLALLHTAFGVCSVKIFAFLEGGEIGNMSLFGGVFFMPLLYILGAKLTKRSIAEVCDVFTACMLATLVCARCNCILSGCCRGLFVPGTQFRFPTRELEILYYIVMLVILLPKMRKGEMGGKAYPLYMASYGAFRFVIEFFRVSSSESLFHLAHIWAMVSFALGSSIYETLMEKRKKQGGRSKR